MWWIIGASLSEPHTSELAENFALSVRLSIDSLSVSCSDSVCHVIVRWLIHLYLRDNIQFYATMQCHASQTLPDARSSDQQRGWSEGPEEWLDSEPPKDVTLQDCQQPLCWSSSSTGCMCALCVQGVHVILQVSSLDVQLLQWSLLIQIVTIIVFN